VKAAPPPAPDYDVSLDDETHRSQSTAAARGILICAVVMGHNTLVASASNAIFHSLYFWHVLGFFLISEISPKKPITLMRAADLGARYLVPFAIFTSALSLITFPNDPSWEHFSAWILALITGSAERLERATSASYLWFLPTLFSLALTMPLLKRILFQRTIGQNKWGAIALVGCIALLGLSIIVPTSAFSIFPLGSGLILYIAPLALIFSELYARTHEMSCRKLVGTLFAAGVVILAYVATMLHGNTVNISVYKFYGPGFIAFFPLNCAAAIAANLVLLTIISRSKQVSLLSLVGERSMHVFVFHPFFQTPAVWLASYVFPPLPTFSAVLLGVSISGIAVLAALAMSFALDRIPRVKRILFPRDVGDFLSAAKGQA